MKAFLTVTDICRTHILSYKQNLWITFLAEDKKHPTKLIMLNQENKAFDTTTIQKSMD